MKKMMFIAISLQLMAASLAFADIGSGKAGEVTSYVCQGEHLKARIEITEEGFEAGNTLSPLYSSVARIDMADGKVYDLKMDLNYMTYFEQEVLFGQGMWNYDKSRLIFALGGAQYNLSGWDEGFHLEIKRANTKYAKGYLGNRDHEKGPVLNHDYDFTCRKL